MCSSNLLNYYYYDFSNPWEKNKLPLVLIHGLGANSQMWFPQLPDFSKYFPVITIDLPGCGKSQEAQTELTIEYMAESLNNTINSLNIQKVNILGISLGGFVAIEYATRYADKTNKLILASTPYGFDENVIPILKNMLKTYENMTMREIAEERINKAFGKKAKKEIIEYLVDLISQTKHSVYLKMAEAPLKYNAREKIAQIKNQTLILIGELDYLASISEGEKLNKIIKNSKLKILSNTGHASSLENPLEFNEAVISFILND